MEWKRQREATMKRGDVVRQMALACLAVMMSTAAVASPVVAANRVLDPQDAEARYALFAAACRVRRQIAFANPLLNFD